MVNAINSGVIFLEEKNEKKFYKWNSNRIWWKIQLKLYWHPKFLEMWIWEDKI